MGGCKFKPHCGNVGMLEVEATLEGVKALELEWAGRNPLVEVDCDTLDVIKLLTKEESSFALRQEFFIENILFAKGFVKIVHFYHAPCEENKVAHTFAALTSSQDCSLFWKEAFLDCFLPLLWDEVVGAQVCWVDFVLWP